MGGTRLYQGFLFAVLAETVLSHVHDLSAHLGVLQLHDAHIFRCYTRHFKGRF